MPRSPWQGGGLFYFPLIEGTYPDWIPHFGGKDFLFFRFIFNVADSAISVGVVRC
jgi:signal peptidase II